MYQRKNIRLSQSSLYWSRFYFVTLCCHQRHKIFTDPDRCRWLLDCLRAVTVSRSFNIHTYCIMLDHTHLLAQGLKPSSDFLNFVKAFKIKTSREFANETNEQLWQKRFLRPYFAP
jgi:REP element-mobilizing transposase RayT